MKNTMSVSEVRTAGKNVFSVLCFVLQTHCQPHGRPQHFWKGEGGGGGGGGKGEARIKTSVSL